MIKYYIGNSVSYDTYDFVGQSSAKMPPLYRHNYPTVIKYFQRSHNIKSCSIFGKIVSIFDIFDMSDINPQCSCLFFENDSLNHNFLLRLS